MKTFNLSLQALKHPLTLVSISLLLINDHILKTTIPSWFTGKLSDFAGLFFFPFLLAALLGLPSDPLRISSRRVAAVAFGITLLWFTAIKTIPWVNDGTEAALSLLLGAPAQIIPDPTDLIALVILWPAWRLWHKVEQASPLEPPGQAAYLALSLATIATMATSPCFSPAHVTRVVATGDNLYAGLSYERPVWENAPMVVQSSDNAQNWHPVQNIPVEVTQLLEQPVRYPLAVCEPQNLQNCYRIAGKDRVEASQDGGKTWKVVWSIPWGRRQYIERYLKTAPLTCKSSFDPGPYDLALLNQNGSVWLVVALGSEGVLVRDPDGTWQQHSVFTANPTAYAEWHPLAIVFITSPELILGLFAALLTLFALCFWSWRRILTSGQLVRQVAIPLVIALSLFLVVQLGTIFAHLGIDGLVRLLSEDRQSAAPVFMGILGVEVFTLLYEPTNLGSWPPIVAAVILAIGWIWSWRRLARIVPQPEILRRLATVCVKAAISIFFCTWLPFALWPPGIIPLYGLAVMLAVLLAVIVWWQAVRQAKSLSKMLNLLPEKQ